MTTENVTVSLFRGETLSIQATIRDANGALADLSAATIQWKVRRSPDSLALITKGVGTGITVTGLGTITIAVLATDTAEMYGRYRHECRVTIGSDVNTAFQGPFDVKRTLI